MSSIKSGSRLTSAGSGLGANNKAPLPSHKGTYQFRSVDTQSQSSVVLKAALCTIAIAAVVFTLVAHQHPSYLSTSSFTRTSGSSKLKAKQAPKHTNLNLDVKVQIAASEPTSGHNNSDDKIGHNISRKHSQSNSSHSNHNDRHGQLFSCKTLSWIHVPKTSSTMCLTLQHLCCPGGFASPATSVLHQWKEMTLFL